MEYLLHILVIIEIYAILSVSLNLVAGYMGMLSLAHAAFFGVGAYTFTLILVDMQISFFVGGTIAIIASAIAGAIVAFPSLRTKDDYFVITTFAVQVVALGIMMNWISVTNGPMGLSNIPRPVILGWRINTHFEYAILAGILCSVVILISHRLTASPYGRVLKAIREDEILTNSLAKNVFVYRLSMFVITAAMAGLAGVLYSSYISFIDPSTFTIMESIFIISIVIIGGTASIKGAVLGAAVLVLLPEILRAIGFPTGIAAHLRQILYGGLLVAVIMWRPQGLVGEYSFNEQEKRF